MPKKIQLKAKPKTATYVALSDFAPADGTTLDKLIALIDRYPHVDPVLPGFTVGALVPDTDLLGADINQRWELKGRQRFFQDEIERTWTLVYLAAYIDLKVTQTP